MLLPLLIAWLSTRVSRHQDHVMAYLREENRILKAKLKRKRIQLTDTERRRLAVLAHPIDRKRLKDVSTIATPDTLQQWHRHLVVQSPSGKPRDNRLGRPRVAAEIEQLVVQIANENPRWGYRRIQGMLSNLGYHIHSTTVRNVLRRNHIDPAPVRGKASVSWSQFIQFHWEVLDASGFFEARLSKMAHLWGSIPQLARELSTWGSPLLGRVFDRTLGVLIYVTQKWYTLGSKCCSSLNAQHPCLFGQRDMSKEAFQSVMPLVKMYLVEQDRSPPEPRRVIICPDSGFNDARGTAHPRFVTKPDADRECGQRFDYRHPAMVENGTYPVAA